MKKIVIAAAFAAATIFTVAAAHATAGETSARPGAYAQQSAKYAAFIANCTDDGMSPSGRDEAAKKLEAMSSIEFDKQIKFCAKRVTDQHPPLSDTRVANNTIIRPNLMLNMNQRRGHRSMYQGDRDLLELDSLGLRGRVIKDRQAPDTAVPCIVRGNRGMCVHR